MSEQILVGDVGGTKVRLALAKRAEGRITLDSVAVMQGDDFDRFEHAIVDYLTDHQARPDVALFALAGPVAADGSLKMTNRDWPVIQPRALADDVGLRSVRLVNDFAAMARAIPEAPAESFETIIDAPGIPGAATLVTGPGTGFGVSILVALPGGRWRVVTGQGGHAAFPPRTKREAQFLAIMQAKHGYVSNEMVVAGRWLPAVHEAVCALHGQPHTPTSPQDLLDAAAAGEPVAEEVCLLRACAVMGAIGDAALIAGAQAGVVLTGTVAERIADWLRRPEAVARFHERASETAFMAPIPVRVMSAELAPLVGASALYFEDV